MTLGVDRGLILARLDGGGFSNGGRAGFLDTRKLPRADHREQRRAVGGTLLRKKRRDAFAKDVSEDLAPRLRSISVDGDNRASDHQPVIVALE